ncbi:alpha/beta fold hydrolase [Oceaniglobus ichthyenteri]|uniref:alpha/beta fold hydrolase n=1 Tax=Oceaniglobus ichthyenteri TaxID=2136177 RepID=UPI000F83DAC0|nr:alpha/beta hydrolase [Oceaniglobus ichthyenteri]
MNEPLVLLPSFMADARIWGAQIETFSQTHAIHLAHVGYEGSVEDMAEMALVGAPETFSLAGHGLGAMVAIEMLRRAPERVRRIALMSTNCLSETPPAAAERDLRIARAKAGRLAEVMEAEVPPSCFAPGEYHDMVVGFMGQMALDQGVPAYLRQAMALQRRPDQQRTLRQVRVPTLILCGEHDTLYLPRRHEFMAGLVPRAELVILPGAGHAPMVERPRATNEALRRWMAGERQLRVSDS